MNTKIAIVLAGLAATVAPAQAQDGYTNFIRQVQAVSGVEWDVQVTQVGQQLSPLSIDPGGARFELWTVRTNPLTSYLLDHKYVGTYIPKSAIRIVSEDSYSVIPRTRADRSFVVEIAVSGLLPEDPAAPAAAKAVIAQRHVQAYPEGGTGVGIDRNLATQFAETLLVNNQVYQFQFALTRIPGENRAKVRGEERFTVLSQPDFQAPSSQLASQFIQIWPVADAEIKGIENGETFRFSEPPIEILLNDLYPDSETWAQVYPGDPQLGQSGTIVPGSAVVIYDAAPQSRVLRLNSWGATIDEDGRWTMEVLTRTPFGLERLAYVWFNVNRTLRVKSTVTSLE